MKTLVAGWGSLCALMALAGMASGGVTVRAHEGVLSLKAGDIQIRERRSLLDGGGALRGGVRHVLVLDGPLTAERRAALAAAGVVVGEYLPTHACIADLSGSTPAALRATGIVRWCGEFDPAWKVARGIGTRAWNDAQREDLRAKGIAALNLSLFDGAAVDPAIDAIGAIPGVAILSSETAGRDHVISVLAPIARIGDLAAIPTVGWIEEKPEFAPRARASRWIVQKNVKDQFPLYDAGLHGEGQIIGIIDGWVSPYHCAFVDPEVPITEPGVYPDHRKILAYNAESVNYNLHGTHVAGIAVGDAGDDTAETRGVAYLARMVFNTWPGFTEESVYQRFDLHYSQGASVHSNSWGSLDSNEYDFAARAVDSFSWEHPDNLVLFAVSNGETILNPENAKNCLAVTSCGNDGGQDVMCNSKDDPTDLPGRGPTTDGRRKPEIAAPGCDIWSASGQSCNVRSLDGTSMAAPAVGAVAVLMQQYYREGYYPSGVATEGMGFEPSGMLLKATILNAGVDMTGEPGYPNDYEGWGRLQADQSLYFAGDKRRSVIRDVRPENDWSLTTGKNFLMQVRVDSPFEPLRVTMAFHDAPAALQASYAPVNDLDLVLESPSGVVYAGNDFKGGVSASGAVFDAINNVEQVHIATPETGVWTIRIEAREVNVGPRQGFAVVASGAIGEGCPGDVDRSGYLDKDDFDSFMEAFESGDAAADFDQNGSVEFEDFNSFIAAFEKGC